MSGLESVASLLNDVETPQSFGLDIITDDQAKKDIFAEHRRHAWKTVQVAEARCNFERKVRITKRGVWFLTIWQKSITGRTLTEIKSDDAMVGYFAENMSALLADVFGGSLEGSGWAVCTTPKRRHKERNFATLVSMQLASLQGLPFYEDVATCKSRQRVNAVFELNLLPKERNIIVFDDFVTTGQTMVAMKNLLEQYGKNMFFVAGINNSL